MKPFLLNTGFYRKVKCSCLALVIVAPHHSCCRIQLGSQVRIVDPNISHMDVPFLSEVSFPKRSKSAENLTSKGDNVADSLSVTSVDSGMLEGAFPETGGLCVCICVRKSVSVDACVSFFVCLC